MADLKISQLTAIATIADADLFAIVDVSATETKKGTYLQLKTALATEFDVSIPDNQIAVGTGSGISSSVEFKWDDAASELFLGGSFIPNLIHANLSGGFGVIDLLDYVAGSNNGTGMLLDDDAQEILLAANNGITLNAVLRVYNSNTVKIGVTSGAPTNTTELQFLEKPANGSNYVAFKAPVSIASNIVWELPATDSTGTQALVSNGSGVLSWASIGGGGGTPGIDDVLAEAQALTAARTIDLATNTLDFISTGGGAVMTWNAGIGITAGTGAETFQFNGGTDYQIKSSGTDSDSLINLGDRSNPAKAWLVVNPVTGINTYNAPNGHVFNQDVSITGTIAASNLSGTNTGDQTSIVGISGTKAQFDTACSDGNFLFVGDVTGFTNELAQDAIGAMVDTTLVYVDATPLLTRAALTGDVTAAQGSNATTIANDAVTFAKMQNITSDRLLGRDTASSGDVEEISLGTGLAFSGSQSIVPFSTAYTMLANNTNASAAMTPVAFEDHNFADYAGTLSWNGTPPATIISQKYAWSRIGNTVTLLISVFYTSAGTTNTSAILTMPSDCPNPAVFAEAGDAASEYMYPISGARVETNMTGNPSAIRGGIRRNSGNSAFEIALIFGSVAALQLQVTVIYRTA